ncbi:hypothetical protein I350_00432 [Cryptococcus amylolentus CBS 6273]|uniref:Uncharacterized protein n=1 Tax=Cryptococcus amylolentus CBS 6273 TaxID=1296118 RepID=A0A1E3KEY6_9TREE|nr:hypothetical protein I350_00432 [Cryptococcus amylolentus CBS 6273]
MSSTVSPSKRRSKQLEEEVWDDDFEFPVQKKRSNSVTKDEKSRKSLDDDWDEDWDESPPKPVVSSPSRHGLSQSRPISKVPAPLNIPNHAHDQSRISPGVTADLSLPSPSPMPPSSSNPHQPLLASRSNSSLLSIGQGTKPRSRAGSVATTGSGTVRRKLVKRHPSTSFIPIPGNRSASHLPSSTSSTSISSSHNIVSPAEEFSIPPLPANMPRSTSGEQMPPPPLPVRGESGVSAMMRRKSKSKKQGAPPSPSKEKSSLGEAKEQRKGFWNRLSGGPTETDGVHSHRRRRSSSVGATLAKPESPQPPMPPLPSNLRSPSATSTSTSSSAHSHNRAQGVTSVFTSMLRRSSSSLSKSSRGSKEPPSAYPYAYPGGDGGRSRSSVSVGIPIPEKTDGRTTPEQPQSFSRGFHLPSPSPQSPYHSKPRMPLPLGRPPLPDHTASVPLLSGQPPSLNTMSIDADDSDEEGDKTPRRRKKVPLASLRTSPGKKGHGESYEHGSPASASIPGLPRSSSTSPWPSLGSPTKTRVNPMPLVPSGGGGENESISSGHTGASGNGSGFASTVRRLGSISKKHGRRLSGGWKFGTQSSNSSSNSGGGVASAGSVFGQPRDEKAVLETVMGSPVKDRRDDDLVDSPVVVQHPLTPDTKSKPKHRPRPSDQWDHDFPSFSAPNANQSSTTLARLDKVEKSATQEKLLLAEADKKRMEDKQRRRQSWNDFVIPRNVLEKQKELKEGIGAVKLFARGVNTLKALSATHAGLRKCIIEDGSETDANKFSALEAEFAQWWEMAIVLIEVGSTGKESGSQASVESPRRERRVTLASEEARAAGDALRQASGGSFKSPYSSPVQWNYETHSQIVGPSQKKISLPDPSETSQSTFHGPPRASPLPEQWRASTGRQDLSKRQLEVLRTMLKTPMPSGSVSSLERPGMSRGASTISTRTGSSLAERFDAVHGPGAATVAAPPMPRTHTPLRIDTTSPQGLVVEPPTATAKLNQRRMSKAGLAGLKEFLRSLKKDGGGEKKPTPRRMKSHSKALRDAPVTSPSDKIDYREKSSMSPPSSPSSPTTRQWSRMPQTAPPTQTTTRGPYETSRSSFAVFGPQGPSPPPTTGYVSGTPQSQSSSRISWQAQPSASQASSQPNPKRPSLRNIFRTSSGNWSELAANSTPNPSNGSPGLRKRGSVQILGQINETMGKSPQQREVKERERAHAQAQTMGSLTGRVPGVARSSISVSDPLPHPHVRSVTEMGARVKGESQGEGDQTLKPRRKGRATPLGLGLGWPEKRAEEAGLARSPTSPVRGRPHAASTSTMNSATTGGGETGDEELVVALTPENLPTLLEYLRQCEMKLGEWKLLVEEEGLGEKLVEVEKGEQ